MKRLQEILNKYGASLKVDGVIGPVTIQACNKFLITETAKRKFTIPKKGFVWIRTDDKLSDTFDDFVFRINGGVVDKVAPCSTTAGDYYIFNPITYQGVTGTAIAQQQQVSKSHKFVTSRTWANLWTKMPYFQQVHPISIYRDGNKDRVINRNVSQIGLYGINFHRGWSGLRNWNVSAGCMVVPDGQWQQLIDIFVEGELIDFILMEV